VYESVDFISRLKFSGCFILKKIKGPFLLEAMRETERWHFLHFGVMLVVLYHCLCSEHKIEVH
jgi:hypothetical protein